MSTARFIIEPCSEFKRIQSLLVPTIEDLSFLPSDGQVFFVWLNEDESDFGSHDDDAVGRRLSNFEPMLAAILSALSKSFVSKTWYMLLAIDFLDLQKYLPKINPDLLGDVRLTSDVSGMQILKTKWIRQPTPLPLEIYLTGMLNCYLLIQGFSESFPRVNGVIAKDFDFPDTGLFHRACYFLEKNYFIVGDPDYSVQLATRSGNFGVLVWIKDSKTQLQELLNRLVTRMI